MNIDTIVNDVKGTVEPILAKGQDVVLAGFETLKSVNGVVVDGVQSLFQTQVEAGKDLIELAQASFEKARTDGLKAVAADPITYIPAGRERVVSAYNDTVAVVTKTSDELVKTVKAGYETITAKLNGETVTVAKAKKTVRKTGAKAKKAAAKVTA